MSASVCWLNTTYPVQQNTCSVSDLVDDPSALERAVQKMGPRYTYIITVDGKLLVKIDNKLLRLNY